MAKIEITEDNLLKLKVECLVMINAYLTAGMIAIAVFLLYYLGSLIAHIL